MKNKHRKQERNRRRALFLISGVRVKFHRGIIYVTGVFPDEQLRAIRAAWYATIQGITGWHRPTFPAITNGAIMTPYQERVVKRERKRLAAIIRRRDERLKWI